jgi:nucleotide-binding universal stress UspA family protein
MKDTVFTRILVGVDGSPEGFVALDQARALLEPGGILVAAVVCQEQLAVHAGLEAPRLAQELHADAEAAAARARQMLSTTPNARVEILHGRAHDRLLALLRRSDFTLVAVGSHTHSRAAGVLLGSVATRLLHDAPIAVLIARRTARPGVFPAHIVVGVDALHRSGDAIAAARVLERRFGAETHVITANESSRPDFDVPGLGPVEVERAAPVQALLERSAAADLLVVGSRGAHGPASLASVSERVAHRARCSVLVVRRPTADRFSVDGHERVAARHEAV